MSLAYEPSRALSAKLSRRLTPYMSRRSLPVNLERAIISFTFDDCPVSAIENGVKPLEVAGGKTSWKSTIYVSGSLLGQVNHHGRQINDLDVQSLHETGHEIGGHTWSHIDAQSIDSEAYLEDIARNQSHLSGLGLPPCRTFAYPYGQTQPGLKRRLETSFTGMRGISPGVHRTAADLNQIKSMPLFSGPCMQAAMRAVSELVTRPAWVTFFTHDICEDHSPWGCSPDEFMAFIDAVKSSGADVMPVDKAIDFIKERS